MGVPQDIQADMPASDRYFEILPCPAVLTDCNCQVRMRNRSFRDAFGVAGSRHENTVSIDRHFSRATQIFFQTHIYPMVIKENRIAEVLCRLQLKDGSSAPYFLSTEWIEEADGPAILWLFYPALERERFERALRDARREHQTQAHEMAGLATQREELALRLKRELIIRDRFLSIVAHDLRSPFNALLGMTEHLKATLHGMEPAKIADYVANVNTAARNAYDFLDELLDWAFVHSQTNNPAPEELRLCGLVDKTLGHLRESARSKNIRIRVEIPGISAFSDPDMVALVLRNLVSNAIKFSEPDSEILITGTSEDHLEQVRISVIDNGVGVSAKVRENMFKPDVKTTTAGTAGEVGTGIGLPLCRDVVELIGGALTYAANPNGGSCFSFTLPAVSAKR